MSITYTDRLGHQVTTLDTPGNRAYINQDLPSLLSGTPYASQLSQLQKQYPMDGSIGLSGDQQSIYDVINNQLETWGIGDLGSTVYSLLTQGLSQDAILVQLENSDAFKKRFAGNQARIKNGFAVLSPADYIATEQAYDQVLQQYGINGTFSTRDNFAKWIGNNVSATELQTRAQEGSNLVQSSDPTARNLLSQWYGIGHSDILATFLDPTQAQSALDKKIFSANVGAAMQRYGLGANQSSAEGLFGTVTQDQALSGLQQAGSTFQRTQALAQRYGANYSAQDAINQYVLGQNNPAVLQQQLAQKEEAQFSRGSGFGSAGAGVSSGSF